MEVPCSTSEFRCVVSELDKALAAVELVFEDVEELGDDEVDEGFCFE